MKIEVLIISLVIIFLSFFFSPVHALGAKAFESKAESYAAYMMGLKDISHGKIAEAQEWFKRAYDLDRESVAILKQLSQTSIRLGNLEDAEQWIEKALELEPKNLDLLVLLAKIYIHRNKTGDAIFALEQVVKEAPENEQALLMLGTLYAEKHMWQKARKYLEKVVSLNGQKSFVAFYFLGRIAKEEANYLLAEKYFQEALNKNTFFTPALFELADTYEKEGKIEDAIDTYNSVLLRQKDNLKARQRLLFLLLEKGEKEDVLKQIQALKSLSMGDLNVQFKIALVLLQLDMPKDALQILDNLSKVMPDNHQIAFYKGLALENLGQIIDAEEIYASIPLNERTGIEALTRRARILAHLKELKKAVKILKEAILHHPEERALYVTLSSIYEKNGFQDKAVEILKEGIKKNPVDRALIMTLTMLLDQFGKKKEAIAWAQKALNTDSNYVPALNYIAYTYAELGINLDEAEELAQKAVNLSPEDGYVVDTLGWVYFKKGMYKKALSTILKAKKLVPNDPIIMEHIGDIYFSRQQFNKAYKEYKEALGKVKNKRDKKRIKKKCERAKEAISDMPDY